MKRALFAVCFFVVICVAHTNAVAQTWKWGIRGGSADGTAGGPDETVIDMATDPGGNVYLLSKVLQTGLSVDGHGITGWGVQDIMVSSFKCDGTYRWSKIIGGSSTDVPAALKTDSLGGVYIAGAFSTHFINIHLDTDTTWSTGASFKSIFLVKYDTAGNYKWLRMPESDTVGTTSANRSLDMDVDGAGNVYWMCGLAAGAYEDGSYIATNKGIHILKYSSSGTELGGTALQIGYSAVTTGGLFMKRDHILGRYYITGNFGLGDYLAGLTFNGTAITKPMFLGAFDNTGTLLWHKENTSIYSNWLGRAAVDNADAIYISGSSEAFGAPDTFNSYTIINTVAEYGTTQLVVKLDTAGNNIWAINSSAQNMSYFNSITVNGTAVAIAGNYNGKLVCVGFDSLLHSVSGEGYDVFLMRLNAGTGAFTGLDTLASNLTGNEFATAIANDTHGNVYVGGNFSSNLYVNTDTLVSNGGGSDFFAAKFGYDNCGCTTTPVAAYTYSGMNPISFTYTGTTTGLYSVTWDFGDGNHATGTTASHYYSVGEYMACATAYTSCGSSTFCDTVLIPESVGNNTVSAINIYPNPARDELVIDNAKAGADIKLYTIQGVLVYSDKIINNRQIIALDSFESGTYILRVTDKDGVITTRTVIKE